MLDRYLFRADKLPESAGPDVPRDLTWAVEGYEESQPISEDSKRRHTATVIVEGLGDDAPVDYWQHDDYEYDAPDITGTVAAPPRIRGVAREQIYQNEAGVSRVEVIIDVDGPDDGDYEVVVAPA